MKLPPQILLTESVDYPASTVAVRFCSLTSWSHWINKYKALQVHFQTFFFQWLHKSPGLHGQEIATLSATTCEARGQQLFFASKWRQHIVVFISRVCADWRQSISCSPNRGAHNRLINVVTVLAQRLRPRKEIASSVWLDIVNLYG